MSKLSLLRSDFCLQGQLLDFIVEDGYKLKYLRVIVSEREYWIKIPKELRSSFSTQITPGCQIEVSGTQTIKKTGILKLEATEVKLLEVNQTSQLISPSKSTTQKQKVLVCQKSNCWQRGGKAVCQRLEENLRDRGLSEQVEVKLTGCLKECKKGPNLVIMPDKARYSQVRPQQIEQLLEKHF